MADVLSPNSPNLPCASLQLAEPLGEASNGNPQKKDASSGFGKVLDLQIVYTVYNRWGCSNILIYTIYCSWRWFSSAFFRCLELASLVVSFWCGNRDHRGDPSIWLRPLILWPRIWRWRASATQQNKSRGIFQISRWLLDFSTMKLLEVAASLPFIPSFFGCDYYRKYSWR